MNFLQSGRDLLRKFEGYSLTAYQDTAGIWTIGIGHATGVGPDTVLTDDQVMALFEHDLETFIMEVTSIIDPTANDAQFTAAVCFAYNVKGWKETPLFELLSCGNFEEAKNHWLLYDHDTVNGVKVEVIGLENRRQAELDIFMGAS